MALLGNPFVGNIPKKLSAEETVQALRIDLIGEIEAIVSYDAHALSTDDQRIKKVLTHIADEERQHVGELQQLLSILSSKDAELTDKGKQAVMQQQSQNFQIPMQ